MIGDVKNNFIEIYNYSSKPKTQNSKQTCHQTTEK